MNLSKNGMNISKVNVLNISEHGFWIYYDENEYFLPFSKFQWFINATVSQICNIKLLGKKHLYWEDLDIDLSIESIKNPDKYPLISKI